MPDLFTKGLKFISIKIEHLVILDSVSFLPCTAQAARSVWNGGRQIAIPTLLIQRKTSIR